MRIEFKNISMVAFCAFAIKCLIFQEINIVNAICMLITAIFVGFYEYKSSASQVKHLQGQINDFTKKLEVLEGLNKDVISSLSSVKTSIGMRSQNNRPV